MARKGDTGPTGVVVVDKPGGMTSHDVVNALRRVFGTRRVGHTGTLDPMATGVLVVCLGQATRIAEYLAADSKEYVAGVTFGVTTNTEDTTGDVCTETDTAPLTQAQVEAVLPRFRGTIQQTPPMVSAVHHEGQRLYDLARQGVEVERAPRTVEIRALGLVGFTPGQRAEAILQVECSTGTYIRTLAADIGRALGCGAAMSSLRRTRVGPFREAEALPLDELLRYQVEGAAAAVVRPVADALSHWPRAVLDAGDVRRIAHGQPVGYEGTPGRLVLLVDREGAAIGVARPDGDRLQPLKVLLTADAPE